MTTVISVENLSKNYRLGQIGTGTFAHDLSIWWARVRGKPNPMLKIGQADHGNREGEELWALRDVSFKVEQGEVLGIIGRNGAGKSTLLKILSRVTSPTSGKVNIKGRVASLLEVGTGFHPELTGRENVYLNGAILGMSQREIAQKFDEIIDFAGVERFIDTPVKRYSSGMYVRLAFAVAAHLEPEILIVDEVLAVGDAEFQKKCLGKMGAVAHEGRTVLFVSHNMAAVESLCPNIIILGLGRIVYSGQSSVGIKKYLSNMGENHEKNSEIDGNQEVISSIQITDLVLEKKTTFQIGESFILQVNLKPNSKLSKPILGIGINNIFGNRITTMLTYYQGIELPVLDSKITVQCIIKDLALVPGVYGIKVAVSSHYEDVESLEINNAFEVIASDYWGTGRIPKSTQGVILSNPIWKITSE